ncbi:MAG: hypothetical protein K0R29_690 [Pseudobdellovibrio sp.]|jgi:hypothetical protein|nr:hypothetical protein [Pseudobdellovibrio sp.]
MSKFFFLVILLASQFAFAVSILQVKNNRILLSMDGEKLEVGQSIVLNNSDGKEVAKAIITQAKGEKAIATIKSGKADGSETVVVGTGGTSTPVMEEEVAADSFSKKSKGNPRLNAKKFALLLTASMNNMSTKQADRSVTPNIEDVKLTGMGIGLTGSFDYPLNTWLILRGTLGYEPFVAAGSGNFFSCDNGSSRDCTANISYLSAGGFARVNFTKSKFQLWGGAGSTGKFPISKSSTALRTDDIKLTVTFAVAGGADWFISNSSFVPLNFEYQMFQPSDTVTANQILLRGGYGWAF